MKKVVLTGGPCGGKTTVQRLLAEQMTRAGWRVICIPEVATLIFQAGFTIHDFLPDKLFYLQKNILKKQMAMEDALENAAGAFAQKTQTIFLCDRGALDGKAYCSQKNWDHILAENTVTEDRLVSRYDAVFHLPTLARTHAYKENVAGNPCRFESISEALAVDERLLEVWAIHPRRVVLPAASAMTDKVERIMAALSENPQKEEPHL